MKLRINSLLFAIVISIFGLLAAFLPYFYRGLFFVVIYLISAFFAAYDVIYLLAKIKEHIKVDYQVLVLLAAIIIHVLFLVYSDGLNAKIIDRYEVGKFLRSETKISYKINGLTNEKRVFNNSYSCKHVYNVTLNDGVDINIYVSYCSFSSSGFPGNKILTNYANKYIPYYYELYKKSNNVTFTIGEENGDVKINYNNDNANEVNSFMKYFINNASIRHETIIFHNEDTKTNDYYELKNSFQGV